MTSLSFAYYPSCDVTSEGTKLPIHPCLKIMNVSGYTPERFKFIKNEYHPLACYGELRINYCITRDLNGLPTCLITNWCQSQISLDNKSFNETFELPLPYSALYDYNGICFVLSSTYSDKKGMREQLIAGSNMKLYNSKKIFRQGIYELELHPLEPLGVYCLEDVEKLIRDKKFDAKPTNMDNMNFILKTNRKYLRNELFETPLDKHSIADVERAIEEAKRSTGHLFLSVKFEFSRNDPNMRIPVVFQRPNVAPEQFDTRGDRWNPVDEKYFKMTRNARTADVDRVRKPNKDILERLKMILDLPSDLDISEADGDLIWKHRFYLADKFPEMALAKFILAVRWEYEEQVNQAVELLQNWPAVAPEDVLELFNRQFLHPAGRRFAAVRLDAASDEELSLYLYQLVQALRYENWHDILSVQPDSKRSSDNNVKQTATSHSPITTDSNKNPNKTQKHVTSHRKSKSQSNDIAPTDRNETETRTKTGVASGDSAIIDKSDKSSKDLAKWPDILSGAWKEDLAGFLIRRAQLNFRIANYFYWYLRLEVTEDTSNTPDTQNMYKHVLTRFLKALEYGNSTCQKWYEDLVLQTHFVQDLYLLLKSVTEEFGKRTRKIELLRTKLASDNFPRVSRIERPFPFPLDPDIIINGVEASSASLFKSFQRPALLTFLQPNGAKYRVILKHGDDLRQDQLVLQMIELMDVILRKENFDLKLTPYKVLATGNKHGFVQFVESVSLADIIQKTPLLTYLQQKAPCPTGPLGVQKEVMETYIRSCAGYCVITYLLGIGDRHMENLLLTDDGHLFHIDFSYILGNDPKLMAPEVRLTRAMIEAMGGPNSSQFNEFWKITFTAFLILRRHFNLFLTLFSLVSNTGIQGITRGQSNASEFLKEHFCVHQSEERAVSRLANRMTESIKAIVPDIMERMHTIVQYMRN